MPEAKAKARSSAAPQRSGSSRSMGEVFSAKWRTEAAPQTPEVSSSCESLKKSEDSNLGLSTTEARSKPAGSSLNLVRQFRRGLRSRASESSKENDLLPDDDFGDSKPDSPELESCPICLDSLCSQDLGVCVDADGCRACSHYFHLSCLQRVEGANCPQCRVRFYKRAPLPRIQDDCESWGASLAPAEEGMSRRAVSSALKAMLTLSPDDVDAFVEKSWRNWAHDDRVRAGSLPDLAAAVRDFLPEISTKVKQAQGDSGQLEDGHKQTGVVCDCGQIHVRRGDRIRRGSVVADDSLVAPGQLGTIVRIGDGRETVTVKWDRCDETQTYIWPDPEGLFLAPASYNEVAEDVSTVQEHTNLSSAAAEEFLRRRGFMLNESFTHENFIEENFRQTPKRWHRVRILPDSVLVQQWFDSIPPCECSRPTCGGGVRWSSNANKHLGREGILLQIDESDGTVLVESSGPCSCQIWYPQLAVMPVYDPDLDDKPCHKVNDQVECKMQNGWERGVVQEVLWNGKERTGRFPYSVKLHDGNEIKVPHQSLIRKAA